MAGGVQGYGSLVPLACAVILTRCLEMNTAWGNLGEMECAAHFALWSDPFSNLPHLVQGPQAGGAGMVSNAR